ncbi:MAG: hypothetical protein AB7Y46_05670 [Armatimonadota bacterium]
MLDDFLRQAGKALEGLAGEAARQAEGVKLQARLASLDDDLDRVFIEAGKRARELVQAGQVLDGQLRVILERATAIEAEMMQLRRQIQDLRQGADPTTDSGAAQAAGTCARCRASIPPASKFCPQCGAKAE